MSLHQKNKALILAGALGFGVSLAPSFSAETVNDQVVQNFQFQLRLNAGFAFQSNVDLLNAIGVSEGTRTIDGGRTEAWNQHTDPGNGALNKGSCSWQASPVSTPEEADRLCLAALEERLQSIPPGSSEFVALAYLDAWVQAPLAAADFFKLLQDAPGATEFERVLYARVKAFIDPATGLWDAPGLGNDAERIAADQDRRLRALQKYLDAR